MAIKEMRERRAALAKEVRNLLDKNPGASWTAEHQKTYDEHMEQISALDAEIARNQAIMDADADSRFGEIERESTAVRAHATVGKKDRELFQKWMRFGDRGLSAEEQVAFYNAMSTTTGSEGGFTVQTDVAASVIDALREFGGMRSVAEVFRTASGNPISFPTSDGTSEVGEILAENATATDADVVFGTVSLGAFKYSSKVVTVPIELLQDSSVNVEAFVASRLGTRLGRITNQHFTTGTGSNQPRGIVTALTTGKIGSNGQTVTVTYDDILDLIHSVDPAYRNAGKARFMLHDSSVRVIRKLKDSNNRPLFVPSYDEGISRGAPASLAGYDLVTNQDMPVMAANAKSIAFGDLTHYKIRDVMEMTLYRFTDSAYAKKGQVGFMAMLRSGGNWTDIGGAAKLYVNSAT